MKPLIPQTLPPGPPGPFPAARQGAGLYRGYNFQFRRRITTQRNWKCGANEIIWPKIKTQLRSQRWRASLSRAHSEARRRHSPLSMDFTNGESTPYAFA